MKAAVELYRKLYKNDRGRGRARLTGLTLVLLETRQRTMRSAAGVDNGGSGK